MQARKHEKDEHGQAEKNPIVSNEGTLVSRPILFMHARPCALARRALLLMTLCVLVVAFPTPTAALASNPLGPKGASVSLDFEQTYKLNKKTYVHKGIDLPAAAGSPVGAPCFGTVSFVGDVPAGDSIRAAAQKPALGKIMRAVSIRIADGKVVTLMPFSESTVNAGQTVSEGENLGTLAATGDRSSSKTHLHMGLKKGSVYFDPKCLLGMDTASNAEDEGIAHQAASMIRGRAPVVQGELPSSIGTVDALEPENAHFREQELEETDAASAEDPMESIKAISSGVPSALAMPEDGSSRDLASEVSDAAMGAVSAVAAACMWQAAELNTGLSAFARESGVPLLLLYLLFAALMIALAVLLLLSLVRACAAIKAKKSSSASLLSSSGGDSMGKLFPVPGTTFMTRGR